MENYRKIHKKRWWWRRRNVCTAFFPCSFHFICESYDILNFVDLFFSSALLRNTYNSQPITFIADILIYLMAIIYLVPSLYCCYLDVNTIAPETAIWGTASETSLNETRSGRKLQERKRRSDIKKTVRKKGTYDKKKRKNRSLTAVNGMVVRDMAYSHDCRLSINIIHVDHFRG